MKGAKVKTGYERLNKYGLWIVICPSPAEVSSLACMLHE